MTTTYRRPLGRLALLAFGILALRAFVICPLLIKVNTDIVYMTTIWPLALSLLSEVSQMAVIYLSFAYLIEGIFRAGLRRAWPLAAVYAGAFTFGALANFVMDMTVGGASSSYEILLLSTLSGIGQELAQLLLVLGCALLLMRGYRRGEDELTLHGVLPRGNRMQWAALAAAGVTALFRIGARVIYDVNYGLPESGSEIIEMAVFYAGDLLIPVLGYLGMALLFMHREPAEAHTATVE